jgi:hypothetical protein
LRAACFSVRGQSKTGQHGSVQDRPADSACESTLSRVFSFEQAQ